MRLIADFIGIMVLYFLFAIGLFCVIDFGIEKTTVFIIPNPVSIMISLIVTTILVYFTIDKTRRKIKANEILLTIDLLNPKGLLNGYTDFKVHYGPGYRLLPWNHRNAHRIDTEDETTEVFDFDVNTKTDILRVFGTLTFSPDPFNPCCFVRRGKSDETRKKNVSNQLMPIAQRGIEAFLSGCEASKIMEDKKSFIAKDSEFSKYINEIIGIEQKLLGVVGKVIIGNINPSADVAEAMNDASTMTKRTDAAIKLAKELDISRAEALRLIHIENGKVSEHGIRFIDAPDNLGYFGGEEMHGVIRTPGHKNPSSKKSK